ncbi:hypothetical protein DFH06DRAFT_1317540 [Mycena polygramma]|nr:hypothetical protein DFH06DRAFT_1317540 [Mycena polygramma]
MATDTHRDSEVPPVNDTSFAAVGGTFFAGSQGFTIHNSTLNNITYLTTPRVASDIHTITMGDIDLRRQLLVDLDGWEVSDATGIVRRERRRGCVRRVYSARIGDRKADMTVVVFEGGTAEQELRQGVAIYSGLRQAHSPHPNILQIYGVASSGGIHSAVFHGDLMRQPNFARLYEHSPVLKVYIKASTTEQLNRADDYLASHGHQRLSYGDYRVWIRPSTGLVSVEIDVFDPWEGTPWWCIDGMTIQNPNIPFSVPHREVMAINCLPLQIDSHTFELELCNFLEDCVELAAVQRLSLDRYGWYGCLDEGQVVMPNSWARLSTHSLMSAYRSFYLEFRCLDRDVSNWLSQANHIFKRLQITSNFRDYVILNKISIELCIQPIVEETPSGYLFLCPESYFQTGPASFTWPDCPAYWSLDSSGLERLGTEEAMHLGFPSLEFKLKISGVSWEDSTYAGLRQFHAGKSFDPDSQEIARHLGDPLYHLSSDALTRVDVEADVTPTTNTDELDTS